MPRATLPFRPPIKLIGLLFLAATFHLTARLEPSCAQEERGNASVAETARVGLQPIELLRLRVPRKDVASVATQHLPMRREELQQGLAAIRRRLAARQPKVRIRRARYEAVFDGHRLSGTARWDVSLEGGEPQWLELSPWNVPLAQVQWEPSGRDNSASDTSLLMGVNERGRLGVIIPSEGVVTARWSAPVSVAGDVERDYVIATPPTVQGTWSVHAPVGWELQAARVDDRGKSRLRAAVADAARPAVAPLVVHSRHGEDGRLWEWKSNGGSVQVRLVAPPDDDRVPVVGYEQLSQFRVGLDGLRARYHFTLQVADPEQPTLAWSVPDGLQVTAVASDRTELPYAIEQSNGERQLMVHWPTELRLAQRTVAIEGLQDFPLRVPSALPRLVPRSDAWRQHVINVIVAPELAVLSLEPTGCAAVDPLETENRSLETRLRYAAESADAQVILAVSRRTTVFQAELGTHIRVEKSGAQAEVKARLVADRGTEFSVPFEVAAGWQIVSVDAERPDRVDSIELSHMQNGRWSGVAYLRDPITPSDPLVLTLHCQHAPLDRLSEPQFRIMGFPGATANRWVAIDFAEGLRFQTHRAAALQQVPEGGPSVAFKLLPEDEHDLVFLDDYGADSLRIDVIPGGAKYDSTTIVEMVVIDREVEERFHLRCEPVASAVSQVVVRVEPAPDDDVHWEVISPSEISVTARKLDQQPADSGSEVNAAEYELLLGREVREPIVIMGKLNRAPNDGTGARLVYLPFARTQQAKWALRTSDPRLVDVSVTGMRELPLPEPVAEGVPLRAWYAYSGAGGASARIRFVDLPSTRLCWAVSARARSTFDMAGGAVHQIRYRVINQGMQHAILELPSDDCRLASVRIDGEVQAVQAVGKRRYQVSLPSGHPGFRLDVRVHARGPTAAIRKRLQPELPKISMPVLSREWRVQLPAMWQVESEPDRGWRGRWFFFADRPAGVVGRSESLSPVENASWNRRLSNALLAARREADGPVTWGEFLGQLVAESESGAIPACWVDEADLTARGITPDTLLGSVATDPVSGDEWFRMYGLQWYATVRGYLLAAESMDDPDREHHSAQRPWRRLADWLAAPPRPVAPWLSILPATHSAAVRNVDDELPFRSEGMINQRDLPSIVVWHRGVKIALTIACALITAGLIVRVLRGKWLVWWWTFLTSALLAEVVPSAWLFLCGAWMWGVALSGLWLGLQRMDGSVLAPYAGSQAGAPGAGSTISVVGAVLLLVWGAAIVRGQEPSSPIRWTIVTPVDDAGKPVGEYDYVPRALYNMILRGGVGETHASNAWLVQQASYEATMIPSAAAPGFRFEQWTARWELQVFSVAEPVLLPIPPLPLQQLVVQVDDIPVDAVWEVSDGAIRVRPPQTGQMSIALRCRRNEATEVGDRWRVELLPAPRAVLTVALPGGSEGWRVSVENGDLALATTGQQIEADVGSAHFVEIAAAPLPSGQRADDRTIPADERQWLRLRPESVVLDYVLSSRDAFPEELTVTVDADLQPLGVRSGDYIVDEVDDGGAGSRLKLALRPNSRPPQQLRLRFLWRDRLGIGRFHVPSFQLSGVSIQERQIAVSADDRLVVDWKAPFGVHGTREFAEQWGDNGESPLAVLRLAGDAEAMGWTAGAIALESRLKPVASQAELAWKCRVGRHAMRWQLDVHGSIHDGWRLVEEMMLPPDLRVTAVTAVAGGAESDVRFSRGLDGRLLVFFDEAVSAEYRLRVRGERPIRLGSRPQRLTLPFAIMPQSPVHNVTYELWRDIDVLLATSGLEPLVGAVAPAWEGVDRGAWRLGTFRPASPSQSPSLTVRINAPRLRGGLVHYVHRDDEGWKLDIEAVVAVMNAGAAQVDSLRMSVPPGWADPTVVTEGCHIRAEEVSESGNRIWELIPETPITQTRSLRLQVKLADAATESLQIPAVLLHDVANLSQFFVLPTRVADGRPIWETRGLFRGRMPPLLRERWNPPQGSAVYRVVPGSDAQATLVELRQQRRRPEVALADALVQVDSQHRIWMVARLMILPADRTSAELVTPPGMEIVAASLNRRPARMWRLDSGNWTVRLSATRLPQFLEVVCRGRRVDALHMPSLRGFRVRRTLWMIAGEAGVPLDAPGKRLLSEQDAARKRLQVYRDLILGESASGTAAAGNSLARADGALVGFLHAAAGEWLRQPAKDSPAQEPSLGLAGAAQSRPADAAGAALGSVATAPWLETWHQVIAEAGPAECYWQDGAGEPLQLGQQVATESAGELGVLLLTALVAIAGHILLKLQRVQAALDCPGTWAWLSGLVLFAATGAVGWSLALLVLAMILSIGPRLPRRPAAIERADSRSRA